MEATDSSSIELKLTELLKEVQLNDSVAFGNLVNDTVSAIKQSINEIPEDLMVTGDEGEKFVKDIGADKVEFKFKKPKSIKIGGSYSIKCIAKPFINVDLFVQLPKECFHEKDYLNHRYHAKRFLYLCIIKKYLNFSSSFSSVQWSSFNSEARKPVLLIYPAISLVEVPGFFVRIIPTAKSLFNVSKLDMKRNNVRALSTEGSPPLPTPRYNSSILEDMYLEDDADFVKEVFHEWKELREAMILLKVWARQRSSICAHDCLNGFLLTTILAYLVKSGKVKKSMKQFQIIRVTLDFIANSKLWSQGVYFIQQQHEFKVSKEERILFKESFPVVLCNPFGRLNLTFRMKNSSFLELQDEASLTLKSLAKSGDNAFEDIFMTKVDFCSKYDHCIRLNLKGNSSVHTSGFCLDDECWRMYEQRVHDILHQGLGDRAKFIRVLWRNIPLEFSIDNGLSSLSKEPLLIGISVSTLEKALRAVDIGPDAENKVEALKFRKFWGEKAELRRFRDGKIAESTVWKSEQWEKHHILKKIIEYVLLRHLSLPKTNVLQFVDQLDFSLLHGAEDPMSFSASLLAAFDVLSKRLRLLDDIPLKVSSVQPLDPAFRFTSVFPPKPHPLASEKGHLQRSNKFFCLCIQPLEVMIQLEGSGNWPMDEVAIEKTKSSFLLKIGESLQNGWGMTCTATEDDVEIFVSGYAFRLKILHERGLNLVKKQIENYKVKQVPSTDKKLFLRGQHSSMINGLQGLYPMYGPVVRLAKRWVASHLFSACLAEEAIELLVAHLFLKPLPFMAPCSRITGFLRFLRLLAEYDWAFAPLVVDINNDLTPSDTKEISEIFLSSRKGSEENMKSISPSMFLATSYDKASDSWTGTSPNSSELKRLIAYARSSSNLLTKLILENQTNSFTWECLFRTPLNNYDAIILLHGDRLPYPQRLLFPSNLNQGQLVARGNATKAFKPLVSLGDVKRNTESRTDKLLVNFDPLRCYIANLEEEFDSMKFWYDSLGGDAIGLTWDTKKRHREEDNEPDDPIKILKAASEVGKGFVKSVYFLKPRKLTN